LPSQAELSENYMPSIVDGLIKRPRTDHNANLGSIPTDAFTHIILRDEVEKYVAVITTAGAVRVFDMAGVEKTVTNSGASYLSGLTSAKDELTALTIADHTFIVNKKKVAAAGSTTAATRPFEALINVQAGNYAKTYRITINGTVAADFTTPDGSTASHGTQIATDYIADQLLTDLIANGYNTSPWAVGRYHSAIYIRNTSTDFTLGVEDGYAGRAMKDCKGKVQKFSDLPLFGPDGVVFEISGTEDTGFDNYWVRFEKANNANTSGVWKETTKPGSILGLNAATMPHILRRNVDGTFTFLPWTWGDRKCGDDVDTVPNPSFVGQTIADIFFHRNRLGLLTSENTVMSEAGVFGNFFRTTLTALLDTDPIDVAASHTKVSLLNHAVPYQDVLLLFSDKTQFRLAGNELLTPKTVNIRPLTELSNTPTVKPVVAASSVYFASENDEWCNLYEYFIDKPAARIGFMSTANPDLDPQRTEILYK
ncbi:phage tail protein, partial [bacterium]|nr:phage tail protein [bacterium]